MGVKIGTKLPWDGVSSCYRKAEVRSPTHSSYQTIPYISLDSPGTHLPQNLCTITRTVTQQNIAERIALISAQNNLAAPNKAVSQLVILALEVCDSF